MILAGCSGGERSPEPSEKAPAAQAAAAAVKADSRPVVVAFGDSLTAGLGAEPGQSYPDFLQEDLDQTGYRFHVVNQGISGDTTSGGVERIDEALSLKPKVVILELGANDGLRGLPVESTRENLSQMIDACRRAGATVLLCGMTLPRNYGPEYIRSFEDVFHDLTREKKVTAIPFLLEGVATRKNLMQADGLHPTGEGNAQVARNVLKYLVPLLK
jgi:acyl-CoA thioesterase I